jgi:small subunit ribosomal protein S20
MNMANIKSAKKRILTNEKSRMANKRIKTNLKTTEKKFQAALQSGETESAIEALKQTSKKFDMAASKGVIHKNAANRKKSQIAKRINQLVNKASQEAETVNSEPVNIE